MRIFISRSDRSERAVLNIVRSVHLFRVARTNGYVAALDIQQIRTRRSRKIGAQHPRAKLNIPPSIFPRASRRILSSSCRTATAKKEVKQTREGRREAGAGGGEGHRRWLSETPRPHDQCHGAFIVLQQKGAHQSTGISSRLISRGHPLVLARHPFHPPNPPRSRNPYGSPSFPPAASLSLAFCSEAPRPPLSFFRPSAPPRRPPFFGRSVGEGCERPTGGRRQIAGRRSAR